MNPQRTIGSGLIVAAFSVVAASQVCVADDYVWARTNWGSGMNRPVSAMTNGYGGYYVPRNAYGNNYDGRTKTNPTGYVVPAQPSAPTQPAHSRWFQRWCHR